jgi:hypothetical protein
MNRASLAAVAASSGTLFGAALHPALPASLHLPPVATTALALLFVLGLLAGSRGQGGRLVGLGAIAVAAAVGYDGLRGHRGTLALEPGQGAQRFEEEGPDGRPLGLRPLDFDVVLERVDAEGRAVLRTGDGATLELRPGRAATHGGLRFGVVARVASADASILRITVAGPGEPRLVELNAGQTAMVDGLQVFLERYFPDFALDPSQQPYSRSAEPRNPAALLRVTRGSEAWRVFVIRAMPGIHRPEGLEYVLSLTDVVPREVVRLRVSREPAAALALAGVLLMAAGVAWPARTG